MNLETFHGWLELATCIAGCVGLVAYSGIRRALHRIDPETGSAKPGHHGDAHPAGPAVVREVTAAPGRDRRQHSAEAANRQLRRRFSEAGVHVDDAVPIFTGLYPAFGGYGKFELVFTRSRVLALIEDQVQVWRAATGPMPTTLLASHPLAELTFPRPNRRRYDHVRVGDRRVWIHRRYRERTRSWTVPTPTQR